MIRCIFNEISRTSDRAVIQATFYDESGYGIARYRIEGSGVGELAGEELADCPRTYTTPAIEVMNDQFPVVARATECGEEGAGSAAEGYTNATPFDIRIAIPVEPEENPCNIPSPLRMEEGTPSAIARQSVLDIAAEIEELCDERRRHHEDAREHESKKTAFVAAATALIVAGLVCLGLSTIPFLSWLAYVAAALLVAGAVLFTIAAYHAQEARRAREAMEDTDARLEEARERFREAVAEAIRASCGLLPTGMPLDPPECD
jgi:hypothetical protein